MASTFTGFLHLANFAVAAIAAWISTNYVPLSPFYLTGFDLGGCRHHLKNGNFHLLATLRNPEQVSHLGETTFQLIDR